MLARRKIIIYLSLSIANTRTTKKNSSTNGMTFKLLVRLDLFQRKARRGMATRAKKQGWDWGWEKWIARGRGTNGTVIEYGGVWRSARTTRSICMLGDVDHVGRGWPATPGSWLASGHPNATPTPTHAVLNPLRATQPPCTSTEASPQPAARVGEQETAGLRGWGGLGVPRGVCGSRKETLRTIP